MNIAKHIMETEHYRPHTPSSELLLGSKGSQGLREKAEVRLHSFHRCGSSKINFWSLTGEALHRFQLKLYFAQYGTIVKLFLRPDGLQGSVQYKKGANLCAAAGRVLAVAGSRRVAFVQDFLPRVFLGGLNPRVTEAEVRAAVAPFGNVAKFERRMKKGRPAGFCLLTFFTKEEVLRMLQHRRVEVRGRQVTVRMEGERKEPNRIYDHYGPEWREGYTMLLYGFGDPDVLTEHEVAQEMSKYGRVTHVQFVFKDGRRRPRCFVDFEEQRSVRIALKAGSCCVQDQIVGFMEVTHLLLDRVTGRPKVKVAEDPLDDDLEVPLVKEFDITAEEKEQALQRALSLVGTVCDAFLSEEKTAFVQQTTLLALAAQRKDNKEHQAAKRKREDSPSSNSSKLPRIEKHTYSDEEMDEEEHTDKESSKASLSEDERKKLYIENSRKEKEKEGVFTANGKRKAQGKMHSSERYVEESEDEGRTNMKQKQKEKENQKEEKAPSKVCVENYEAVRDIMKQLSWRCLQRRNLQGSQLSMLTEHQQSLLQPRPAQDTMPPPCVPETCLDEYIPDEKCRVYIQELPEDVQRRDVMKHFAKFGDVLRLYLTRGSKGFVEYEFPDDAKDALKKKRHVISGKEIRVLRSHKGRPQVFVGNLPPTATREDVTEALSVVGKVFDVKMIAGKNFAFATLRNDAAVTRAETLGYVVMHGRRLFVNNAHHNKH
ncbi:Heterogeneous nuclear ribonucleoprotein 27C [Portunus trituberculatus]|uniref:Heterogeneous nuclear ribonucleoprotein 27C n=1 Tax=Portunus trituberculatus TaxID=210409 RepID=A0A5B7CU45_PORTR|nr:Heterogeneous nuclear ribonucleoprotein 27C [Portunus trituberculatus]